MQTKLSKELLDISGKKENTTVSTSFDERKMKMENSNGIFKQKKLPHIV